MRALISVRKWSIVERTSSVLNIVNTSPGPLSTCFLSLHILTLETVLSVWAVHTHTHTHTHKPVAYSLKCGLLLGIGCECTAALYSAFCGPSIHTLITSSGCNLTGRSSLSCGGDPNQYTCTCMYTICTGLLICAPMACACACEER